MKRKIHSQSYLFMTLFFAFSCSILNNPQKKLFTVKDAYYQSWMISGQEKGTTVTIIVTEIDKDVNFDSIVFRGVQMPVNTEVKESTTVLKSILNRDQSRLLEDKNTTTNKPDQLLYRYKEEKKSYILDSIRRENMKYVE
jgi:hypothetical protein